VANQNQKTCPICDSKDIKKFIEISQVPVYCNLLFNTRQEALSVPKADMKLGFCKKCGHVYNYAFDPSLMDYRLDYENSLHFSPRFQEYAEGLANDLVERYNLRNKDIIEIGCGDGDFLSSLCLLGNNRGLGFDPSHVPDLDKTGSKNNITFIRDYYAEKYSEYMADLICCRHVLEHIRSPQEFVRTIRRTIGNRPGTVVFFEVPNVMFTLKDLGIWDLIYEHCSYFSSHSLAYLFDSCGFETQRLSEAFEGQFLCIDTLPIQATSKFDGTGRRLSDNMADHVSAFSGCYYKKVEEWNQRLGRARNNGLKTVVWGAGSKGVTFLNTLQDQSQIKYIVDINPHKQGMHVAGTGQEIVSPEFLQKHNPDIVVSMNPIYLEEVRAYLEGMNVSSELIPV
jgi:hypothetical protein